MFYYGKHVTSNPNDSYLGSGVHLERAIKKYGREHFHKEIVCVCSSEQEMNEKEREIVTEELVRDRKCYNMMLGGEGGTTWKEGEHHSDETKQKLSEIARNFWEDPEYREKTISSINEAKKEKLINNPEQARLDEEKRRRGISKALTGLKHTYEHRKAISNGVRRYHQRMGHTPVREKRQFHCDISTVSGKRVYVTNNKTELRIYIEELDWFLNNGWRVGRNPANKKSLAKTKESMNRASGKGKLVVHNKATQENKRILPEELQSYLDLGWERGYLNKKKRI